MMGNLPIVEKCLGCNDVTSDNTCKGYFNPAALWRRGNCPRATHLEKIAKPDMKLNPLKASKRASKGV